METNIVRIGKVSVSDPAKATVNVVFSDMDNMVSTNLPIIFPQGLKNKAYAIPDIGENVLCIFLEQGLGDGFCVGCFYTESEVPPVTEQDKVHYAFEDGTFMEYDRKEHKLTAKINGNADIKAKDILIEADNIEGKAKNVDLSCTTLTINSTGDISLKGSKIILQGTLNTVVVD